MGPMELEERSRSVWRRCIGSSPSQMDSLRAFLEGGPKPTPSSSLSRAHSWEAEVSVSSKTGWSAKRLTLDGYTLRLFDLDGKINRGERDKDSPVGCFTLSRNTVTRSFIGTKRRLFRRQRYLVLHLVCSATPDGEGHQGWWIRQSADASNSWMRQIAARLHDLAQDTWEIGGVIGIGGYSSVRALTAPDGTRFAMKIMDNQSSAAKRIIEREISILEEVSGLPNMAQLKHSFVLGDKVYLVMDWYKGGDLFSRIAENGPMTEVEAKGCLKSIAQALKLLHDRGIVHADVKPENIVLADDRTSTDLVLIDFGLSQRECEQPSPSQSTRFGTPGYMAPEVIVNGKPSRKGDIFGAGTILYLMLIGEQAFVDSCVKKSLEKTLRHDYDQCCGPKWEHVSEQGRLLARQLLSKDPRQRPSLDDILRNPWVDSM